MYIISWIRLCMALENWFLVCGPCAVHMLMVYAQCTSRWDRICRIPMSLVYAYSVLLLRVKPYRRPYRGVYNMSADPMRQLAYSIRNLNCIVRVSV